MLKSLRDLTNFLEIKQATYTGWKTGRTKSYTKYLPQIAKFLNTTVDDLLSEEEKPIQTNMGITISPFELELLKAYWSKPEVREAVNKLLDLNDRVILYTAANSDNKTPDGYIAMTPEEWEKLKETPETDEPLV